MKTTSASLYEISGELGSLLASLDDGEIPEGFESVLDALQEKLEFKLDGCCRAMRAAECRAVGLQAEIDRLIAARDAEHRRQEWLKKYVQDAMERSGMKKVETPLFKLRIQANSRPSIRLPTGMNPDELPKDSPFRREKIEVLFDGTAAYEAWKRGGVLPDFVVVKEGSHLRVS